MAEIHHLKTKPVAINWMCSACGVDAGCNCGAPLMSKAQRVRNHFKENPDDDRSNVAIADEIGADEKQVRRERPRSDMSEREKRIGKDGKSYPASREAEAIAANPEKSDRAIAADLGVSAPTVGKARRDATVNDFTVEDDTRIGRDGKKRRMPVRDDDMPTEEEADESWQEALYDQACLLLERMAESTRRKIIAHIKDTYL